MALDSSGNIAVDFVWGNTPLQPNTERGIPAPITGVAISNGMAGGKAQFMITNATGNLQAGASFVLKATSGYSDANLTIESVEVPNPGSQFITCVEPHNSNYSSSIYTGQFESVVSLNTGGGEGDYGWSPTTKVKSDLLDPALDGHNITTEFWNNFPGYTPNAGFVPQQVFSFEVANNWNVQISSDQYEDNPYNAVRHGYVINLYNAAMTTEKQIELKDLIISGALAGERVPATTFTDGYGNPVTLPEGWIVGSDYNPGAYPDQYTFTIQVATAPNGYTNSTYAAVGNEFVFGVGAPKEVIFQGVNGTDFDFVSIQGATYNGVDANFEIYSITPAAGSRLVELVNSGEINGAWVGLGIATQNTPNNDGDFYYNVSNLMKVTSATVYPDQYGNYIVKLIMAGGFRGSYAPQYYNQYQDGDTIVVIK
jgi:hypothetical protein